MSEEIKIGIDRTGFPVKIGNIDLWFDSSLENMKNFLNADEIAENKIKESQEKAKHIHFPENLENIEEADFDSASQAVDIQKELVAIHYDIYFGEGTFKRIYEKYPDVLALENALAPLESAISERIIQQQEERTKKVEDLKEEALNKQQKKRS